MKYRRYERVIAISDGIRKALSKVGVPEQKLRLVHSAVDAENCQPQWTREQFLEAFGLDSKHLVVVCAAQLIPRKGHSILLDAWSEVSSAVPSARLLLFGSGSEAPALRARLQQSVAGGTVQLLGFRADLRAFLGHADLVVHPALMEGLGVALLEAQAAGVPVIATRVGGIPEAIADKKSGLLVDPDSADALSHALVYALRDAALRERLGAGGRAHVAEFFTPERMVSGNLDVYREIVTGLHE